MIIKRRKSQFLLFLLFLYYIYRLYLRKEIFINVLICFIILLFDHKKNNGGEISLQK